MEPEMEGLCLLTSKYTVEINICDKQTVDINIGNKHCSEALLLVILDQYLLIMEELELAAGLQKI